MDNIRKERDSSWYDNMFQQATTYHEHYTQSHYYFLWSVIVDRLIRHGVENILDIGCGPGQFSQYLYDKGFRNYTGVDFSDFCVRMAKRRSPNYRFVVADIIKDKPVDFSLFDCVLILETLEHITEDVDVLAKVKPGTRVIITVPNFDDPGHVRYFNSVGEVAERYRKFFEDGYDISAWWISGGATFYLLDGIRNDYER